MRIWTPVPHYLLDRFQDLDNSRCKADIRFGIKSDRWRSGWESWMSGYRSLGLCESWTPSQPTHNCLAGCTGVHMVVMVYSALRTVPGTACVSGMCQAALSPSLLTTQDQDTSEKKTPALPVCLILVSPALPD